MFVITTNNSANIVKEIRLLNEVYLLEVSWQPCIAHTFQLSVREGLKQVKPIH